MIILISFCCAGNNNNFNISDVRSRHCKNLNFESAKPFMNDPDDPSAAALKVSENSHLHLNQIVNIFDFRCLSY